MGGDGDSQEFKFHHTNKWYMHKPESVQEDEMCKVPRDFKIQADHIITARPSDSQKKKKKKMKKPAE